MTIAPEAGRITADDDAIRKALEDAFLPSLIPALAQATGDPSLLRDDIRPPTGVTPAIPQGGLSPAQQEAAKQVAFEAIVRLRDHPVTPTRASAADLQRIVEWMTGSATSDDYVPLLVEELAPFEDDPRAPQWRASTGVQFLVAVIGAGMSGILAGIRLKQAGVPFVIIEKNADVGGTWLENTYPGARVDVPNAFYSYSFAQKNDWPKYFSPQSVLLDYFRDCAERYGVTDHIRFNTEVQSMAFDDERRSWTLRLRAADGDESLEANAVIAAVGQLNRPKMPEIPGRETFSGPSFHSAQWDHRLDLKGRRVAVIGTGASAAQFIPAIAPEVAELTVFQRTPTWFVPVPTYHDDVPGGLLWLFTHIPHYSHWYRFWFFWNMTDGLLPAAIVDPDWPDKTLAVSADNDQLRILLTMYLHSQFGDRPDLLQKEIPQYPPTSKRMVLDNGIWAQTLKRESVHLVTEKIREITPSGVVTDDGVEHDAEVIIYGTGFQASHFLTPMQVTGRRGVDLNAQWAGDANAYMGITVPNFPNFFMLYGPNTNIVVNGSIIFFSECEVQYVMGCLRMLLEKGAAAIDCRREVHDAYNERIDAANLQRTWGVSTVNAWYKNAQGHVTQNWPFNLIEYWRQTRDPDPDDYSFL